MEKKDVLIIFAHPDRKKSLNSLVLDSFTRGLEINNQSYSITDLYAEEFNPIFSFKELREGIIEEDVARHHQMLFNHKKLVFICPAWNYSVPAILKGWIDRVLAIPGVTFSEDENHRYQGGLLQFEDTLILQTFGGSFNLENEEDVKYLDFYLGPLVSILNFCGVENVRRHHFFNLYNVDRDEVKLKILEKESFDLGSRF